MRIALLADYNPTSETHRFTESAITHSASFLGLEVDSLWINTSAVSESRLSECDAIWIAPGSPYQNAENVFRAIRHARENYVPCLGTCGGFQHMVVEYARNALGLHDASHEEYDPSASKLIISRLDCALRGRDMKLSFVPDSRVARYYEALTAVESYYCNFGINPEYVPALKARGFRVVGSDAEGEVRVMEIANHPFYIGTLFVPQVRSSASAPHPLITGFLTAIAASNAGTAKGVNTQK